MQSSILWYREFYDTVYSRATSTNIRRYFLFNYHGIIGPRYALLSKTKPIKNFLLLLHSQMF